ncbi:MAG: amino acid ABC transporter substrate-binding protein [Dehalococcoidia bacterium]|nr:amino acid ABC transporter substrate-binding protein [Dehalococcoidia bacterium]MCB9492280.1 amino acid ABC transporter substrate-binding protein [Dehalococcoidia bacterium]
MRVRRWMWIGLATASLSVVVACTGGADDGGGEGDGTAIPEATKIEDAGPAKLVSDGQLTVCVDAPKYPFAFQSPNGDWLGSDIEIMEYIADDLDLELQVKVVPFDGIWQRPAAGECDLAAAALTITDARSTEALFSRSYLDANQALAVRTPDKASFGQLVRLAGKRIGVKSGTTSEEYLRAHLPTGGIVVPFEDTEAMFIALGASEVDAVLSDLPIGGYRSTLDSALSITEVISTGEQYGFAAASENGGLVNEVNDSLGNYLESDDYRSLLSRWFGVR